MAKRVLHLIHWLNPGGIERWLIDMLHAVPRTEWEMDVCCKGPNAGSLADQATQAGAKIVHCRLQPYLVGFVSALAKALVQGRYDLLHAHVNSHMGLAVAAARRAGIPVVATAHNEIMGAYAQWARGGPMGLLHGWYTRANTAYSLRHANIIAPVSYAVLDGVYGRAARQQTERASVLSGFA